MHIGNAIKQLRQQKGFRQIHFAHKCDLSQSYLSLIEQGKKEPTLTVLKQISDALGIPTPVLIFFSLDKEDVPKTKHEAFDLLIPSIKGMITNIFISDSQK